MVSNPQLRVGDPRLGARNHESGHLRAMSEISLSGPFQFNLSGTSPVQNQRTDLSASEQVVTKAQGFSFSAPFLLPVLGSLPHLLTSSPNHFFTRSLLPLFTRPLFHSFTNSLLYSFTSTLAPLFPWSLVSCFPTTNHYSLTTAFTHPHPFFETHPPYNFLPTPHAVL